MAQPLGPAANRKAPGCEDAGGSLIGPAPSTNDPDTVQSDYAVPGFIYWWMNSSIGPINPLVHQTKWIDEWWEDGRADRQMDELMDEWMGGRAD